ncbi:MAG: glycine zipper domain-containing protein [Caulobacterales bacterium]
MKRLSGFALAAAIAFCAATPASSQMFLDRFSDECKKGALYGAVGGGVLGAILGGKGDRLEGAAIGAAAGTVGGCLISKKMTQDDRTKLLALEKKAAKAGVPKTKSWTNSSKNKIAATAFPGPVMDGCRDVKVDLSVDGGKAENFAGDRFCKTSEGWTVAG